MTSFSITPTFEKQFDKMDKRLQQLVLKKMDKVVRQPELGKPLHKPMQNRFGERVEKLRIIYTFAENHVTFLYFDHRDRVYN